MRDAHNVEPGVQVKPCVVCGNPVELASDAPVDEVERPRCIDHWFDGDPTEDWEA